MAYSVEKVAIPDFQQIPEVLYPLPELRSSIVDRSERSLYANTITDILEATFSTE
jgi:hypothetical protein